LNEPEKAVESLKKAIELDPSFYTSYSNMALAMLGKYDEAEKTAKRAVTLGSKSGKELQARIRDLRDMDDPGFDANSWIIWNN
jgi:Tfp pilus assembly protein PilF